MKGTTVYLYVFDTLSDWEIAYITTSINTPMMQADPGRYQLKSFSPDGAPVTTAGGLHVTPDMSMSEVSAAAAAMLILPGGSSWEEGKNKEAASLAKEFHDAGIPVAAICGATFGLAQAGLLDFVKHTSSSRDFILMSKYGGESGYLDQPAVNDKGIITASGLAPLEFSREVFQELGLYNEDVLQAWYKLFKTGNPEVFAELMAAANGR